MPVFSFQLREAAKERKLNDGISELPLRKSGRQERKKEGLVLGTVGKLPSLSGRGWGRVEPVRSTTYWLEFFPTPVAGFTAHPTSALKWRGGFRPSLIKLHSCFPAFLRNLSGDVSDLPLRIGACLIFGIWNLIRHSRFGLRISTAAQACPY